MGVKDEQEIHYTPLLFLCQVAEQEEIQSCEPVPTRGSCNCNVWHKHRVVAYNNNTAFFCNDEIS